MNPRDANVGMMSPTPVLDLQRHDVDVNIARRLPEVHARRYLALLLRDEGDSCLLGLADPSNLRAQDAISQILRRTWPDHQLWQCQWASH